MPTVRPVSAAIRASSTTSTRSTGCSTQTSTHPPTRARPTPAAPTSQPARPSPATRKSGRKPPLTPRTRKARPAAPRAATSRLRADERVELGDVGFAGDIDRSLARFRPMDAELVAGRAENLLDIRRHLIEGVARADPIPATGVHEPASIRMDQAAKYLPRPPLDERPLPVGKPD